MKTFARFVGILMAIFSFGAFAQNTSQYVNEILFKQSLTEILRFEKPSSFAVMDETISANDIVREKVPRHLPQYQFSKWIKGVSYELELALIYNNLHPMNDDAGYNQLINKWEHFDFKNIDIDPQIHNLGIIDQNQSLFEEAQQAKSSSGALVIIKFSRPAIRGKKALVYAESKFIRSGKNSTPVGGGYGLLFQHENGQWHLITRQMMWQGGGAPF